MNGTERILRTSLALSAGSFSLALVAALLGQVVYYLDHLRFFNFLAVTMLVLAIGAITLGVIGTVRSRGRKISLWLADLFALALVAFFVWNP